MKLLAVVAGTAALFAVGSEGTNDGRRLYGQNPWDPNRPNYYNPNAGVNSHSFSNPHGGVNSNSFRSSFDLDEEDDEDFDEDTVKYSLRGRV